MANKAKNNQPASNNRNDGPALSRKVSADQSAGRDEPQKVAAGVKDGPSDQAGRGGDRDGRNGRDNAARFGEEADGSAQPAGQHGAGAGQRGQGPADRRNDRDADS